MRFLIQVLKKASMFLTPVSSNEVIWIINFLNMKKAPGYNGITATIVKVVVKENL